MRIFYYAIFLAIIFSNILLSQSVNWVRINIDYGNDIEVLNDSILFVAADGGIKYSDNGGDSWVVKNPDSNYYFIKEVARNNLTNSIFITSYLDRKIFKSTDNGNNWTLSLNNSGWISTIINYEIPASGLVTIKIYDVLGREIETLVNEEKNPGRYKVKFDGSNLASGFYFYRITSNKFTATRKMLLMK